MSNKAKALLSTAVGIAGATVSYYFPQHAEFTLIITGLLVAGGWIKRPAQTRLRKSNKTKRPPQL